MEAKKRFLEKSLLGRDTNFNDVDDVVERCIKASIRDMMVGGRYFLTKKNFDDQLTKDTTTLLEKHKYVFSKQLIMDEENYIFKGFDQSKITKIDKSNIITYQFTYKQGKKAGQNYDKEVTSFGLAQKVINMSYKHFYVFDDYLKSLNIDYSKCDCPLDKNVLSPTKKDGNPVLIGKIKAKGCAWTRITEKQYDCVQNQIDNLLQTDKDVQKEVKTLKFSKNTGRMKYDFIAW